MKNVLRPAGTNVFVVKLENLLMDSGSYTGFCSKPVLVMTKVKWMSLLLPV